jgi:molybdenum cofactor cytidylyltransferase
VDIARVRTVVLGGGRSQRMGFDKLTALFDGEPLARRVARGLGGLDPLFVTTQSVVTSIGARSGVTFVVTPPTAGPSVTLALANAAIDPAMHLAVLAADLPFLDAAHVRAFVGRVRDDVDLAWPVVAATPGHPVLWSPNARAQIAGLGPEEPPARIRAQAGIRVAELPEDDDAYVTDVDTPDAWVLAEARARRARR